MAVVHKKQSTGDGQNSPAHRSSHFRRNECGFGAGVQFHVAEMAIQEHLHTRKQVVEWHGLDMQDGFRVMQLADLHGLAGGSITAGFASAWVAGLILVFGGGTDLGFGVFFT